MLPTFFPLAEAAKKLPARPGSYILRLRLNHPAHIRAGVLGEFDLPAATYFYCGSAFGPGGLRARVLRHTRAGSRPHWHIDALLACAALEAVAWEEDARRECTWSQWLSNQPGALVPIPGFGATDCRNGCPAHLVG